jgi:hypothetical protein
VTKGTARLLVVVVALALWALIIRACREVFG